MQDPAVVKIDLIGEIGQDHQPERFNWMPARCANSSTATCGLVPTPVEP
jgi:hypothetical protein